MPCEETADAGLGPERLEEFDGTDEGHSNALGFEGFGCGTALAGQEFVETTTLFDGVNGDRHVIERAIRGRGVQHRVLDLKGFRRGSTIVGSAPTRYKESRDGNE